MKIKFWNIISHIVPGFILLTEIIYVMILSDNLQFELIDNYRVYSFPLIILFSIPLGIIVDGVHHRIIGLIIMKKLKSDKELTGLIEYYKNDTTYIKSLGVNEFNRVFEAFYIYSEAYINIATSLIPMIVIVLFLFNKLIFIIIFTLITSGIILFLYYCGYRARKSHVKAFANAVKSL